MTKGKACLRSNLAFSFVSFKDLLRRLSSQHIWTQLFPPRDSLLTNYHSALLPPPKPPLSFPLTQPLDLSLLYLHTTFASLGLPLPIMLRTSRPIVRKLQGSIRRRKRRRILLRSSRPTILRQPRPHLWPHRPPLLQPPLARVLALENSTLVRGQHRVVARLFDVLLVHVLLFQTSLR